MDKRPGQFYWLGANTNAHYDTPRQLNRTNHATKPCTSNKRSSGTSRALMRKYHERVYSLEIRELSRDLRETVKRSPTSRIILEIPCRKVLRYFNDNLNYYFILIETAFNIEISDYNTMFYTKIKRENSHI